MATRRARVIHVLSRGTVKAEYYSTTERPTAIPATRIYGVRGCPDHPPAWQNRPKIRAPGTRPGATLQPAGTTSGAVRPSPPPSAWSSRAVARVLASGKDLTTAHFGTLDDACLSSRIQVPLSSFVSDTGDRPRRPA